MKRNVFEDDLDSLEGGEPVFMKKRNLYRPDTEIALTVQNRPSDTVVGHMRNDEESPHEENSKNVESSNEEENDYKNYPLDNVDEKLANFPKSSKLVSESSLFMALQPSVGLKMMQRMGFQIGQTLGKDNIDSISEPIQVIKKSNRLGIGAIVEDRGQANAVKEREVDLDSFRATLISSNSENHKVRLKVKLMRSAMELAEKIGPEAMNYKWLWQPYIDLQEEEHQKERSKRGIVEIDKHETNVKESEVNEVDDGEKDDRCYDQKSDCFGDGNSSDEKIDHHTMALLSTDEVIDHLITYLRSNNYCFFCGCIYEDAEELLLVCPGPTEEDHK